jgi:death-on-curing protein
MIDLGQVLRIHKLLVEQFGGPDGVRDINILEFALNRPLQTFDGQDLYPNTIDKAAAILESIVKNHPFVDGNKRTGYVIMRLILLQDGMDIAASQSEKFDLVIKVASGELDFEGVKQWLSLRGQKVDKDR